MTSSSRNETVSQNPMLKQSNNPIFCSRQNIEERKKKARAHGKEKQFPVTLLFGGQWKMGS
jgi:hypothetical protein